MFETTRSMGHAASTSSSTRSETEVNSPSADRAWSISSSFNAGRSIVHRSTSATLRRRPRMSPSGGRAINTLGGPESVTFHLRRLTNAINYPDVTLPRNSILHQLSVLSLQRRLKSRSKRAPRFSPRRIFDSSDVNHDN